MTLYVQLQIDDSLPELPISAATWQAWFSCWLDRLDPPPASSYELSLRLTNDREIQSFNAQYRQQDRPTDILAFAALEIEIPTMGESEEPLYLGDLVLSVETANQQARERGHTETKELAWLAAHGLLHLLGWDHPDDESLDRMLCQQEWLLQQIDLNINSN